MNNYVLINQNSGKDTWQTPPLLFKKWDDIYHFTLDPCSTHENALCERHYTVEEDGLNQCWGNDVVFMNPPYGRETGKWIKKACEESLLHNIPVICLIPARTDTSYWHDYIFPYATQIDFIRGRLHYSGSKDTAPFPSCVIVFNGDRQGNLEITTSLAEDYR